MIDFNHNIKWQFFSCLLLSVNEKNKQSLTITVHKFGLIIFKCHNVFISTTLPDMFAQYLKLEIGKKKCVITKAGLWIATCDKKKTLSWIMFSTSLSCW